MSALARRLAQHREMLDYCAQYCRDEHLTEYVELQQRFIAIAIIAGA